MLSMHVLPIHILEQFFQRQNGKIQSPSMIKMIIHLNPEEILNFQLVFYCSITLTLLKITLISSGFSFTCRQFAFLCIVLFIPHCLPWISRLSLERLRKKWIIFVSLISLAAHLEIFPSLLCHPLFISLKLINASSPSYLVLVFISFDFCSKFSKIPGFPFLVP